MSIRLLILVVDGGLLLSAAFFNNQGRTALSLSVLFATAFVAAWQAMLLGSVKSSGQTLRIENGIRQPHYVQGLLQTCLYLYWGLYWDGVGHYVPQILVQLLFAYAVEIVLSWTRYGTWRAGFGPVPVVLSINLFLWFRDEYYVLQFALIGLTYFCKEFIRWKRDGRSTHIFNPSGFSLACLSIALLATNNLRLTKGAEIVEALTLAPNVVEVIFLLGVVVQLLYLTTLVTLGAVLAQCVLYYAASAMVGVPIGRLPIEVSVFVGLTLLVTDPSTSPRTNIGKFLFGVTYGAGIFLFFIALRLARQPAFVDKILMVPIVNLMVPLFDRVGAACNRLLARPTWLPRLRHERFVWVALYTGVFVIVLPSLKDPVILPSEKQPFPPPPSSVALPTIMDRELDNRTYCRQILPGPFQPFGFVSEISEYRRLREIYLYRGRKFRLKGLDH